MLFAVDGVEELAHHLDQLVADAPRRQQLALAAAEKIRSRFTFAEAAGTLQGIYESVLSSRRGSYARLSHLPAEQARQVLKILAKLIVVSNSFP